MQKRLLLLAGLALWISSAAATADDKDLLKRIAVRPNLLIVFGNSQTTEQPLGGRCSGGSKAGQPCFQDSECPGSSCIISTNAWDGDADSPGSKMATAKAVLKQFINERHASYNIGMSAFSHGQSSSSVALNGKHWLYSPLTVDFPNQSWKEPVGTIERWGLQGEGPCTNLRTPACTDRSPNFVTLPSGVAGPIGPFFGVPAVAAFIYLDGTTDSKGQPQNATKRIQVTLSTTGACSAQCKYGDAYTDGSLSTLKIAGPPAHSMEVIKVYQVKSGSNWVTGTLTGDSSTVTVPYVPSATLTPDLFYTTGTDAGKEIGFLNDDPNIPIQNRDLNVNATCAGWEFAANNATIPLVRIPRDYSWGGTSPATCKPPQESLPCVTRLLRPQSRVVSYNQASGVFTANDYDNPGYLTNDDTQKYQDGCDKTLLGAVDANLNDTGRQVILQTQNSSQAPIKNLLQNIYDYFNKPAIDGFLGGSRTDDPNANCRNTRVILIYDNFNGCQNDNCDNLNKAVLSSLKDLGVKVYVIGFGQIDPLGVATGTCIADKTGAVIDGKPAYFTANDAAGLLQVLNDIASVLNESPETFATSAVSTSQALGDQMAYFASFRPTLDRSIWNGRLAGYKLDVNGQVQTCRTLPTKCPDGYGYFTIKDPNDAHVNAVIPVPSSANPSSLIWNAGQNLHDTPGTGATDPSAILTGGWTIDHLNYSDDSNDNPATVPTNFYHGRKIIFSLPKTLPQNFPNSSSTLPIPAADAVPENQYDMTFTTGASWWPVLRALLGPQTSPPLVRNPPLDDTDATSTSPDPKNSDAAKTLRFIWGDRDAVTGATVAGQKYSGQKLGDILHSAPLLVGSPNDFALFKTNTSGYQAFFNTYQNRRRVLYVGANDGLLHAFDAGVVGRGTSPPTAYDLGTGAELFAFAPRAIMQIYKPLKDAVGAQTKQDEWTVDLSPSAADVFIDAGHSGTPVPGNRAWHTVLVSGVREGSPFEGTAGVSPRDSQGSYFALDITQPDEIAGDPPVEAKGTSDAPKCLNASGNPSCLERAGKPRDWPTVLWEITDSCGTPCTSATGDLDASGSPGFGYPDMGETWSKPAMGRVKVCTGNCDNPAPSDFEDHYVAIFGGGFDRERLNRRGNWLYMVDIETGKTLYKVNSSCGVNGGSGCIYFGSVPSGPTALDYDGDGYLDLIYVGDLKGQVWRIDLTNLRKLSSPPPGRFANKLDLVSGSGKPFLFFQAEQPISPATTPFFPIYHRPEAINLGYNVGGKPALGIGFGTGDRDDILARVDPSSLGYPQRFYYVVDTATNTTTRRESNLLLIGSPTANPTGTCSNNAGNSCSQDSQCPGGTCIVPPPPANGWFLMLINGERLVGDSLTVGGVIRFPTFNPNPPVSTGVNLDPCGNRVLSSADCAGASGVSRLYQVFYANGNAYHNPGYLGDATDRGETQPNATFITGVTGYLAGNGQASGVYWAGGAQNPPLGVGRKITVRSWKEKTSRP